MSRRPRADRVLRCNGVAVGLILCLGFGAPGLEAQPLRGTVDSVIFRSQALGTTKRYVIYLPPSYERARTRRYPVAYYLHGLWGDETNWTTRGGLHHTLDSLIAAGLPELIVVMPDADDSWYTTWNFLGDYPGCLKQQPPGRPNEPVTEYCVPWPHYDDYIARDLVAHVDSTHRTLADRRHRGIAGLSMGGYGAVWLAVAYPDVFAAAASHSGVLSPLLIAYDSTAKRARYAKHMEQLEKQYPPDWKTLRLAFGRDTAAWWARDPGRRVVRQATRNALVQLPAIYVDVGLGDRFLNHARAFRDAIEGIQLHPEYYEREGAHDWGYWRVNAAHSVSFLARVLTAK
ncbi:MAG: alpha/beta hydrolase [Gemmatimonadaceae bacterium]